MAAAMSHRLWAEFIGTFWLVLGGCGTAVLAAKVVQDGSINMGVGFVGVALAFGLTVVTGAYALGHISGGHFNPAVTFGCAVEGASNGRQSCPTGSPKSSERPSPVAFFSSSLRARTGSRRPNRDSRATAMANFPRTATHCSR